MESLFTLLPDSSDIVTIWKQLIITYQVIGKQAHDTRLVAAMITHQIPQILTFNTADFNRFAEITAIDPRTI